MILFLGSSCHIKKLTLRLPDNSQMSKTHDSNITGSKDQPPNPTMLKLHKHEPRHGLVSSHCILGWFIIWEQVTETLRKFLTHPNSVKTETLEGC